MSSSIVLSLRVLGMPDGAGGVVVMAVALGLFLAVAVALWRPMRRRRAVALADEPLCGGRRPAAWALWSSWPRWTRARAERPAAEPAVGEPAAAGSAEPAGIPVIGYVTLPSRAGKETDEELAKQAEIIARACERRGLVLLEVVSDPHTGPGLARPTLGEGRPGLRYALGRIAAGDAHGLVVPGLLRLARSAAELGPIVAWFTRREARLVAVAQGLDTAEREGRVAARLIIEVSRWEREGLWEGARRDLSPRPSPSAGAHDVDDGRAEALGDIAAAGRLS
jgi:Resolvase, N terminal domain